MKPIKVVKKGWNCSTVEGMRADLRDDEIILCSMDDHDLCYEESGLSRHRSCRAITITTIITAGHGEKGEGK